MSGTLYKNKKRNASKGSQSETPSARFVNGTFIVSGYQGFKLSANTLTVTGRHKGKFNFIKNFLAQHKQECSSVSDIGASNGLVSFMAAQAGYSPVYALDHDLDCIKLISKMKTQLGLSAVIPKEYSFGDDHTPSDIVIMGALIHWIYSCTSLYGNFDDILSYVKGITTKYLLIEFVNPNDGAIRAFKHISFNKNDIKQPYNRVNFVTSLQKHFSTVTKVYSVTNTRELFLCKIG